MKKRVLSLVLCMSMVLALLPQTVPVAGAADGVNEVFIRYYADAELTQEVSEVLLGDEFYAAVSLNNFSSLGAVTMTVGYDMGLMELLDSEGNPAVIDNNNPLIMDKGYVDQRKIGTLPVASSAYLPSLSDMFGNGLVTLMWLTTSIKTATVTNETVCAVLRFRAVGEGDTYLTIPAKDYNEIYDGRNPQGFSFMSNYNTYSVSDCSIMINDLSISAGNDEMSGTCGDGVEWLCDGSVLYISGSGTMTSWATPDEVPWASIRTDIKYIAIDDGVGTIGDYAFYGCEYLSGVTIPESVTVIGREAFRYCGGLGYIAIPASVKTIKAYAFANCNGLTSVEVSEGVTSIAGYGTFFNCSNLARITLPETLKSIGSDVFHGCKALTIYGTAGTFAESYATNHYIPFEVLGGGMDDGFIASGECGDNLTWKLDNDGTLTISGEGDMWDWEDVSVIPWNEHSDRIVKVVVEDGVTSISPVSFAYCSNLTTAGISDTVTEIGDGAFAWCESLVSVNIPSAVEVICDEVFYKCTSLTEIVIPESVYDIRSYAFGECTSLEMVVIPESVSEIGARVFVNCPNLTIHGYTGSFAEAYAQDNNIPFVSIGGGVVEEFIASGECGDNLTWKLDADGTLVISGTGDMWNWDYNGAPWSEYNQYIYDVVIERGATSVGEYAFAWCTKLESVQMGKSVVRIGHHAFFWCDSITELYIPASVELIEEFSIECCQNLTVIRVDDENSRYCDIDGVVFTADMTELVKYPCGKQDSTYNVPEGVKSIGNYAFNINTRIETITIPEGVENIGEGAFYECGSLKSIEIPEGVATIGEHAFIGCTSLEDITLPETLKSIGFEAFGNCKSLEYLIIPKNVTDLGEYLFFGCDNLTVGVYSGSAAESYMAAYEDNVPYEVLDGEVDDGLIASGECGDNLTWKLDNEGTLTISGTGDMTDWSTFGSAPWNSVKNEIKKLVVEDGVDSIGDRSFSACTNMTSVSFPDGLAEIGMSAFYSCHGLGDIVLPSGLKILNNSAFAECSGIVSAVIPEGVTTIGERTFEYCRKLKTAVIPSTVESMGFSVFSNCSALSSVEICEGVTKLARYTFANCSNLTAVTIPESVVEIEAGVFSGCPNLTISVYAGSAAEAYANDNNIPYELIQVENIVASGECGDNLTWKLDNEGTLTITGEGDMWEYNAPASVPWNEYKNEIRYVVVSEGVTSLCDYAFCDYGYVLSVTLPESMNSIGIFAFKHCVKLESIDIPYGVTEIKDYSFAYCQKLRSVNIPETVAAFGKDAFYGCNSIGSITIPEGTRVIASGAFDQCTSLVEVVIPEGVESIGARAFYFCQELREVYIPASVTYIGDYAFDNCNYLTIHGYTGSFAEAYAEENKIPFKPMGGDDGMIASGQCGDELYWDLLDNGSLIFYGEGGMWNFENYASAPWYEYRGNVKTIFPGQLTEIGDYAFSGCINIEYVDIPATVARVGDFAFFNCEGLKGINLSQINELGSYAFYGTGITEITIPEGVCEIGEYTFAYCYDLESIALHDGVNSIGNYAFFKCDSLKGIKLPEGLVSIGSCAFEDCYGLRAVEIPKGVSEIGSSAFYGCMNITLQVYADSVAHTYAVDNAIPYEIIPDESIIASGECGDNVTWVLDNEGTLTISGTGDVWNTTYVSWSSNKSDIKSVIVEDGVTSIGLYSFNGCTSLTSITIPDGVTAIGYKAFFNTAYYNDESNWENGILYIGKYLIEAKSDITSANIKEGTVTIGDGAFNECSSLTSITIPEGVTSIGDSAFWGCSRLASITIPDSVTSIGDGAFSGCKSLTSITIPYSVTSIGDSAFYGCSSLASITIPDSVTSIGEMAFYDCESLASITIGNSVTSIGDYAFYGCSSLTSITIPDSVTSIGDYAFWGCSSLTSVTIPEGVTRIGEGVFSGCSSLTLSVYEGSVAHTYAVDNAIPYEIIREEPEYQPGDINGDSKLNVRDIVTLRRYIAGGFDNLTYVEELLDVNGDGRYNVRDVVELRRIIANS